MDINNPWLVGIGVGLFILVVGPFVSNYIKPEKVPLPPPIVASGEPPAHPVPSSAPPIDDSKKNTAEVEAAKKTEDDEAAKKAAEKVRDSIYHLINNELFGGKHPWADQVDFYGTGILSRQAVIQKRNQFFGEWPTRDYRLSSLSYSPIGSGAYKVDFRYGYTLKNAQKTQSGSASEELVVNQTDTNHFVISYSKYHGE